MNPFEGATKAAIEELIRNHAQSTKFGFVISPEGFSNLTEDIYTFVCTSRTLKDAGDQFLSGATKSSRTRY